MNKEQKETLLTEVGKILIDIAKLVLAGVVLAGIMQLDINKALLFSIGITVVFLLAFSGIAFLVLSKSK